MNAVKIVLVLFIIVPAVSVRAGDSDGDRIFSATELASLDRENEMWRTLRVDEDVDGCVQRLLSKGFSAAEVARIRPKLETIWVVELDREFGWLPREAIEKIESVDRMFIPRLRAVRLYETVGIRSNDARQEKMGELSREWQRAIQHELDYREIREFRLVNSLSAQKVAGFTKDVALTTDEFRVLCGWQRDFDGEHVPDNRVASRADRRARLEDGMDLYARIRQLLGDVRFAVYLSRAETDFAQMNQTLARVDNPGPGALLDLWWLKQKRTISLAHTSQPDEWKKINERTVQGAEAVLGRERFVQYSTNENAQWLAH